MLPFDTEALAKEVVSYVTEQEGVTRECEVNLTMTGEEEIRELNRDHRGIDRVTDVLSFPMLSFEGGSGFAHCIAGSMENDPENGELILGDIVCCLPKIRSQAEEYGHSEKREFAFLLVHSLLHLFGYDHIEEEDRIEMEERQRILMDGIGIKREDESL